MTDGELDQLVADAKAWLEEQPELPFTKQHFQNNILALVEEIKRRRSKAAEEKVICPPSFVPDGK